jgi:gamma-glutamyltranspeptidase / glutathione hydrolase
MSAAPPDLPNLLSYPYTSQRMPLLARNVVSTSQPLAASAGLLMLARGGNAVDAALATAITLTVVEPCMNGIGGDAFAILWDGQQLHGLNASGRAPAAWTPGYFAKYAAMPPRGWDSVALRASWLPGLAHRPPAVAGPGGRHAASPRLP